MLEQLKSKNTADLLLYLFTNGFATKADMVRGTALGNSTVSDAINELGEMELVRAVDKEDSIGGRRAIIYELNKSYGCFVGIACKSNGMEFVITDCQNNILKFWFVPSDRESSAISVLFRELRQIFDDEKNVLGIGVGLHGDINYNAQTVICCDDLNWQHVPLKEVIEREFFTFTLIDHYSNGAARKERFLGMCKDVDNFIYYTNLAPQKMSIIIDGHICRGKNNMAGNIGSIDNFNADVISYLTELRESVAVEKIIFSTDEPLPEITRQNLKDVIFIKSNEFDLSLGMAASVEMQWFNHIPGRKGTR